MISQMLLELVANIAIQLIDRFVRLKLKWRDCCNNLVLFVVASSWMELETITGFLISLFYLSPKVGLSDN